MITNHQSPRDGGRPRRFEDSDVFRATASVLTRLGDSGLTLEAVAKEIGCSAPAISRRFGSKQALIRSYLAWTLETARERFRTARQTHASPLAALYARYLIPLEARPEELSAFAAWFDLRHDPEFTSLLQDRRRLWEREAASLLTAARDANELNDCDTEELARAVTAALAGATLFWAPDDGPLLARYAAILDLIIGPYRISRDSQAATARLADE